MTESSPSISIEIITTDDGRVAMDGGGAIQILVDGKRLNRYVNENKLDEGIHWKEYAGDDIVADLSTILETTTELMKDPDLYDIKKLKFSGYDEFLVLEYLGEGMIRVAYRSETSRNNSNFLIVPSSACGYTVKLEEWTKSVYDAVKELQIELRENGEEENADWLKPKLEDLKENISA